MITSLNIPDLLLVTPEKHRDDRGFFSETYNRKILAEAGFTREFVQDNHSLSIAKHVVRGFHFQSPPFAQDKLVRVISGRILDVALDIRKGSPTFGQHVSVELSAENWRQLLIPAGFAHAFCTLEPDTQIVYKVTEFHAPDHEGGVCWNDPDLAVAWLRGLTPILSEKDKGLPKLKNIISPFDYKA